MMTNTHSIDRQEYPFESHYLQVPAGRLHYADEGSGPAVVMVHDKPTWSYLYRHMIKQLQPEYHGSVEFGGPFRARRGARRAGGGGGSVLERDDASIATS